MEPSAVEPSAETPAPSSESKPTIAGDDGSPGVDFDEALSGAEARIAELQRDIENAAEEEITVLRRLEAERTRRIALEQELHSARDQAGLLLLDEAARAGETAIAEAEDEASRITGNAVDEAKEIVADAKEKSQAIVEQGRARLRSLEIDAEGRIAGLERREADLEERLTVLQKIYDDLQETLKLVAETSIDKLFDAQHSVVQLEERTREE